MNDPCIYTQQALLEQKTELMEMRVKIQSPGLIVAVIFALLVILSILKIMQRKYL